MKLSLSDKSGGGVIPLRGDNEANRDTDSRLDLPWVGGSGLIPSCTPGMALHWMRAVTPLQGERGYEAIRRSVEGEIPGTVQTLTALEEPIDITFQKMISRGVSAWLQETMERAVTY